MTQDSNVPALHTPGPWDFDADEMAVYRTGKDGRYDVCVLSGPETSKTPGDLRLIAAAPTMLAALEEITRSTGLDHYDALMHVRSIARASIAKARGVSQCGCPACKTARHASDCAVHNAPALPVGPCDCGANSQ